MKGANSFGRPAQAAKKEVESGPLLPKAKDNRVVLGFRITESQRRAFRAKVMQEGTTVQEVLSEAVDKYLEG